MINFGTDVAAKKLSSFSADGAGLFPVELILPRIVGFEELVAFLHNLELLSLLPVLACVLLDVQVEDVDQEVEFGVAFALLGELSPVYFVLFADSPNFGCIKKFLLCTFLTLVSISSVVPSFMSLYSVSTTQIF